MKLLYSYANLLAIFNHRVISGVHATINNNNRQLQLNQAEAAKRVDNAVDEAMLSVEKGDVTGIAFPLNYILSSSGTQQLTVNLRLPGVDRNQNMLVDTGTYVAEKPYLRFCPLLISYVSILKHSSLHTVTTSSTGSSSLAFCNKSLAEEATDITKINYVQCNQYDGGATTSCPDGVGVGD